MPLGLRQATVLVFCGFLTYPGSKLGILSVISASAPTP